MENILKITYYDFRFVVTNKGYRLPYISFDNNFLNEIFGYYEYTLNNLSRLHKLIAMIDKVILSEMSKDYLPGGEEAYINANKKWLELVITLPGYEQPYFVKTEVFLPILKEYENWLTKIENGDLPGIVPESKLDTWVCVPKEYVKEDYWKSLANEED